jgi:hypothetical protein
MNHADPREPAYLRVWDDVGHGSVDPHVAAAQHAEWLAFVMQELGMSLAPAALAAGTPRHRSHSDRTES